MEPVTHPVRVRLRYEGIEFAGETIFQPSFDDPEAARIIATLGELEGHWRGAHDKVTAGSTPPSRATCP